MKKKMLGCLIALFCFAVLVESDEAVTAQTISAKDQVVGRCAPPPLEKLYTRNGIKAIVIGKIVKVEQQKSKNGYIKYSVILDVSQAWKSAVPNEITYQTGPVFAYAPPVGEEHLLLLSSTTSKTYVTDSCSGNKLLTSAKSDVEWLNKNGKASKVEK